VERSGRLTREDVEDIQYIRREQVCQGAVGSLPDEYVKRLGGYRLFKTDGTL
jgi:hypothetical protein